MAAVAAYNSKGQLIGGSVGLSGRPVLAAHPLPILLAYGFLARVRSFYNSQFCLMFDLEEKRVSDQVFSNDDLINSLGGFFFFEFYYKIYNKKIMYL